MDLTTESVMWIVLLVNNKTRETTLNRYAVKHGADLERYVIQQNPNHRILVIRPAQAHELFLFHEGEVEYEEMEVE